MRLVGGLGLSCCLLARWGGDGGKVGRYYLDVTRYIVFDCCHWHAPKEV